MNGWKISTDEAREFISDCSQEDLGVWEITPSDFTHCSPDGQTGCDPEA